MKVHVCMYTKINSDTKKINCDFFTSKLFCISPKNIQRLDFRSVVLDFVVATAVSQTLNYNTELSWMQATNGQMHMNVDLR